MSKVDEILGKFFIIRVGTPDDDLEELKARNQTGQPRDELKSQLLELILESLPKDKYENPDEMWYDGWKTHARQVRQAINSLFK